MARRYFSSIAQRTTLASSCTDSGTTIVVTAATGFPSSVPFPLVLDADTVNEEAVLVTSRVGTTCTVTRAYDGTTGVAHSAGATVRHTALALDFNEASEHVNETTTAHGLTLADVITTSNTKTLTNKTLTTPTIGSMVNANHDHSAGAGGGLLPASSVLNRPINDQSGTTYTFVLADARKHVTASNASSQTYTIPPQADVVWLADARIPLTNLGAGVVTVAAGSGVTLNGSDLTLAQGESAVLLRTASNVWWCLPFSTGSALARGTLSGTTSSPATSSNGGATAYKWTSSGDFTVATGGLFTGLVVGGGGGGGKYGSTYAQGGGGGGGQVLSLTDFYLAAGTYTVTVGAGGAAGGASVAGVGSRSVLGPFTAAGGAAGAGTGIYNGGDGANGGGCDGQGSSIPGRSVTGGYAGGDSSALSAAGGGGGAGAVGADGSGTTGGAGGAGVSSSITGSAVTYGGGGGGGGDAAGGAGGSGGGGAGAATGAAATAGTANTGGGGGGSDTGNAGAGGTGVVVLLVGTV